MEKKKKSGPNHKDINYQEMMGLKKKEKKKKEMMGLCEENC